MLRQKDGRRRNDNELAQIELFIILNQILNFCFLQQIETTQKIVDLNYKIIWLTLKLPKMEII